MRPTLFIVAAVGVRSMVLDRQPPIGADSARRFLLLHGAGTSAGAFVNSPTASGAKKFLSGVPCRTDAGGGQVPPNWLYSALDAGSADGSWWKGGDAFTGVEDSILSVQEAIQEQQAVGLVGHGQGATLAALVAARSALGEGPPLKFAIFCGAAMPADGPYADLLRRLSEAPAGTAPATLHCVSASDPGAPVALAEELAGCFGANAELLRHDNGRAMPGRGWWEETRGFPERVTGGTRWVTEAGGPYWY